MAKRKKKAQRRSQRRREKSEARADAKRLALRRMAERLGLGDLIRSPDIREAITSRWYPRPVVEAASDTQRDPRVPALLEELKSILPNVTFECPVLGSATPVVAFFELVFPVLEAFARLPVISEFNDPFAHHRRRLAPLAAPETVALAVTTVHTALENALIRHGRIDCKLYFLEVSASRNEDHQRRLRFVVHAVHPEITTFESDRGPRKAFRCGQPFGPSGIEWATWDPANLGIAGVPGPLPVYVQSHALHRLYERLNFIRDGEWFLHDLLWQSLRQPEFVGRDSSTDRLLVIYRLAQHRLGYLACRVLRDKVVVETFLFLTMDGTPEGQKLRERLRLRRPDREYLGLDEIGTFLASDIQEDEELVAILSDCGCGHLFKMLKEPSVGDSVRGYASDLRRYLKLPTGRPS